VRELREVDEATGDEVRELCGFTVSNRTRMGNAELCRRVLVCLSGQQHGKCMLGKHYKCQHTSPLSTFMTFSFIDAEKLLLTEDRPALVCDLVASETSEALSSAMLCLCFQLELDDCDELPWFDSGTGGGSIAVGGTGRIGRCDEDIFAIVREERRNVRR
jgi:hypothetical protein